MTEPKRTVDLGVWRTPLEPAPRLAKHIGLLSDDLWIKRDDWLGLGGGGNKLRKLEHLCADAIDQGATTLVTGGAPQSNYCRLTAAAARRLGLEVVLVLEGDGRSAGTGNLTLEALFDAEVHWAGDVGAEGLGDAVHFVVAVGSGGTMAGLVAGLGADRVLGVDAGAAGDAEDRVAGMVSELRDAGHAPGDSSARSLRLDRDQVGPGYEALTEQARTAMTDAGRCEAVILDPVYTAKAFAGLSAAVRSGEIRPGQRTVFVHTGGLPGLYGHPVASELATRIVQPASGPA